MASSISDKTAATADPRTVGMDAETAVNVTRDNGSHEVTTVRDGVVSYDATTDSETHTAGHWPVEADQHVREIIDGAIAEREARENTRANHRNFNRMLTLFGALLIGLVVTYTLQHGEILGFRLPPWAPGLAPYSFVITVALDSFLALYSFIRHY